MRPNKPSTFRLENCRFPFWPWHFPDRTERPAVFSNYRPKNFRFCPFGKWRGGVNPGWPVTRHIRSSDPRILTPKCCDRVRSVVLIGSYPSAPCVAPISRKGPSQLEANRCARSRTSTQTTHLCNRLRHDCRLGATVCGFRTTSRTLPPCEWYAPR
jgi:hypothetical protein